jgi:hypothetical protein
MPQIKNQKTNTSDSSQINVEKLLKENLELTKEIHEYTKKTRRYIMFAQILGVVKVIIIVGPIILAILYLPPLISEALGTYSDLLGSGTGQTVLEGNSFLKQLFGGQPQE